MRQVAVMVFAMCALGCSTGVTAQVDGGDWTDSGTPSPARGDAGTLAPCASDQQCAQGFCDTALDGGAGICTVQCGSDSDCPADAACWITGGLDRCRPLCKPSSDCSSCSCKSGSWCQQGNGCVPPSDVGGPCLDDSDCKSGNCGEVTNTCRVALGSNCTAENCDVCFEGSGYSYCSRMCDGAGHPCNSADQCVFVGPAGYSYTLCLPTCGSQYEPSCPTGPSTGPAIPNSCELESNMPVYVCDCTITGGCIHSTEGGNTCGNGNDCVSGTCSNHVCTPNGDIGMPCKTATDCTITFETCCPDGKCC